MTSGAWQAKRPEEKRQANDGEWYTEEEFWQYDKSSALGGRNYWKKAGWKSAESGPEPSDGTADSAAEPAADLRNLVLLSLGHCHSMVPRLLLLNPLLHLRNLVLLSLGQCHSMLSNLLWFQLHHPGRIPSSCRKPFPSRKPSLWPAAGISAVPLPHARPLTWRMHCRVSCRYLHRHSSALISAVASQHCEHPSP